MMTFFTEHIFGLNLLKEALVGFLSGAMVPLSFMGKFGEVISYLPFAYLSSTPTLILMNKVDYASVFLFLVIGIIWIVLIESVNKLVFSTSMKKLVVQGG